MTRALPAPVDTADYVAPLVDLERHVVPAGHGAQPQGLVDPLSAREITVLRHLASQMDSTQIAAAMCLSVNTVRTPVKAIYRKLGVNSRTDTLRRGRELNPY